MTHTSIRTNPTWVLNVVFHVGFHATMKRIRSLVRALAAREIGHQPRGVGDLLERKRYALSEVLEPNEGAVLLGFSSDGNFLIFYSQCDAAYFVHWKYFQSFPQSKPLVDNVVLRLHIERRQSDGTDYGAPQGTDGLHLWESPDDQIVVAITSPNQIVAPDDTQSYHIVISASPFACQLAAAASSYSLAFTYSIASPNQPFEPWQLVTLAERQYLLVLNMGSSIVILAFGLVRTPGSGDDPHHEHLHVDTRDWFRQCEYPFEFQRRTCYTNSKADQALELQCWRQHEFDVEAFFAHFLQRYTAFRLLHLVDYDLQLVRINGQESMLYAACTTDLESRPSITKPHVEQSRLALFFSLSVHAGEYHIIRALRVPRQQPLRRLSVMLARKFRSHLSDRCPSAPPAREHTNDPVVQGRSLAAVDNPRFPVSIYLD